MGRWWRASPQPMGPGAEKMGQLMIIGGEKLSPEEREQRSALKNGVGV